MRLLAVDGTNAVMRRVTVQPDIDPKVAAEDTTKRILRAATDLQTTHIVVALDSSTCWRYTVYPDYKGAVTAPSGFTTAPYSLALGEVLEARGIKVLAHQGYEADDVLATVAHRFAYPKVPTTAVRECCLLSSDNDLIQLAGLPNVRLFQYAAKGATPWLIELPPTHCMDRFGIPPVLYTEYLTLVGGKNKVPGLPKVGAKRAVKLLLDGDIAHLIKTGKIEPEQATWLDIALRLHTLVPDVPLAPINPKECHIPS